MQHRLLLAWVACLGVATGSGCAAPGDPPELSDTDGDDDDAGDDDDDDDDNDDDSSLPEPPTGTDSGGETDGDQTDGEPEPDAEHALGVIALAEAHSAGGGGGSGSVSVAFVPDAAAAPASCLREVAGCELAAVPECSAGCDLNQYCGWNDSCEAACLDACTAECDADEVCYFASPGEPACRDREDFDAGAVAFTGTTTPITLFPPYAAEVFESGSPFAPGSELIVDGSGATAAGLEPFSERFTTTALLQTELDDVTVVEAYGDADMPVRWAAGQDDVTVTVTVSALDGTYGTVTCPVDDAMGSFNVPRAALQAALDDTSPASVAVAITRTRTEVVTGLATKGQLDHALVQPTAWLELTTASTESIVVEGCGLGELVCGDECIDVAWDPNNCGDCGEVCNGECFDGDCLAEDDDDACSDNVDNDGDGYVDCQDYDCAMNPSVTVCDEGPENYDDACEDGFDNDGDGYVDCDDFDCSENPGVSVC